MKKASTSVALTSGAICRSLPLPICATSSPATHRLTARARWNSVAALKRHIFQLRTKYSEALKCELLNDQGKPQVMEMGCYGIGVSRNVGAAIEQGHDDRGIILPAALAPFEVVIVPMGYAKSDAVKEAADKLYAELQAAGVDVILDDRDERPGVMFADWNWSAYPTVLLSVIVV